MIAQARVALQEALVWFGFTEALASTRTRLVKLEVGFPQFPGHIQ